ncbi:uncharacterized protein LOC115036617 isoform X2 [Echeneis naucrates]|uniref:uncharacterized protein LOC115036617 isoform X2 n=1 Tax=Echeneis naucrates TaxID=173247 RepID=UPI001113F758|nr:uncharacterized protein LOC115036617 isoform X2 [Echeneis naucrates]
MYSTCCVYSLSIYSFQETRNRMQVIPQRFKYQQLSPVLESALSDHSASDYLPPTADHLSPFSSTSSAPSGQGIFPLELRSQTRTQLPPQRSPPPWDTSGLEQIKLQHFSHSREMTDNFVWSCGSNLPLHQLETPTSTQVLFGSPDETELRDGFCFNQPEDKGPIFDFTLNQLEQQFEEDPFRGFSNEEYESEASYFGSAKSKIYLEDKTPAIPSAPQMVPDTQDVGVEAEDYCQQCVQAFDSTCLDQATCSDTPKQRHQQPRPLTTLIQPKLSLRVDEETVKSVTCPDKALGSNVKQTGSSTPQFASLCPVVESQNPEFCKCKKGSVETRDAETQTANIHTVETRNASTQWSFTAGSTSKPPRFNLYLPSLVDVPVPHPATGRQTDTAAEPNTLSASDRTRSKKKSKAGSVSGSGLITKFTAHNRDGPAFLQRPINPHPDALSMVGSRDRETEGSGDKQQEQQGNGPLMEDLSVNAREVVTFHVPTSVNTHPGEVETLQETADILLPFTQKKEE